MRMSESAKKAVPRSERGVPGKSGTGSYPMPDARHAAAAIGFAAMHHGPAFAAKIRAKAKRLGFAKGEAREERGEPRRGHAQEERREHSAFYGE